MGRQKYKQSVHIRRTLSPVHIWALGVGIVLVGEFMGWNLTINQGGSVAALIGMWVMGMMYMGQVMLVSEMAAVMPEAGGQYTMAKYLLGPLAAFNVGLMQVFEYAMLEAGDIIVVGQLLNSLNPKIQILPFTILTLLVLAFINYRGAQATLTLNFVITSVAFISVIILLFSTNFYDPQATLLQLQELTNGLPYGTLGCIGLPSVIPAGSIWASKAPPWPPTKPAVQPVHPSGHHGGTGHITHWRHNFLVCMFRPDPRG